mgnify:FL=1
MASVFTLQQLVELTELPMRTIRYYIQIGLVDRPIGERRTASYNQQHLQQLLSIKQWSDAGLSLERIRLLISNPQQVVAHLPEPALPGSVTVIRQITLVPGLTLNVDGQASGVSDAQIQALARAVLAAWQEIKTSTTE